jgi:hypothetical protein
MSRRWYRVAVSDGAATTLAAAEAEHPGAAIALVVARLGRGGRRVWPVAAAAVDGGAAPLGEAVGRGVVVLAEPPTLPSFEYPTGVVATLGERARAAIAPGLRRHQDGDTHVDRGGGRRGRCARSSSTWSSGCRPSTTSRSRSPITSIRPGCARSG